MDAAYTGQRILALRKEKGWTQKDLAERLHVTDKAVSKWERGINYPDLTLFEPMAQQLGTSVSDLLGIEKPAKDTLVSSLASIAKEEKERLKREFRLRAYIAIFIDFGLIISQIVLSWILAVQQLYGLPQVLSAGTLGFYGLLIGNEIYILCKNRKM